MTRPTVTVEVALSVGEVLAYRRAGMLPAGATNALGAALGKLGPLELHDLAEQWQAWRAYEDARDAERKAKTEGNP